MMDVQKLREALQSPPEEYRPVDVTVVLSRGRRLRRRRRLVVAGAVACAAAAVFGTATGIGHLTSAISPPAPAQQPHPHHLVRPVTSPLARPTPSRSAGPGPMPSSTGSPTPAVFRRR